MNYSLNKKMEYWQHFVSQKQFHAFGFTAKRLERVLPFVLAENHFWDDVLGRHAGLQMTPEQMKDNSEFNYNHCIRNMMGMVYQIMLEQKII